MTDAERESLLEEETEGRMSHSKLVVQFNMLLQLINALQTDHGQRILARKYVKWQRLWAVGVLRSIAKAYSEEMSGEPWRERR